MQGVANTQSCSTECDPAANKAITCPATLCTSGGGLATYTSPLQGAGYTYSWVASPASAFTVASGSGPTFQTANVPGLSVAATITLTVNTGCSRSFSKSVVVGAPALPAIQGDPDRSDYCRRTAAFIISNYDPALQYTLSGGGIITPTGTFSFKGVGTSVYPYRAQRLWHGQYFGHHRF